MQGAFCGSSRALLAPALQFRSAMRVDEIMTDEVATIDETSTIRDAVEMLNTLDIRHLPVTAANGELVGMLSDRDIRDAGLSMNVAEADLDELLAIYKQPVSAIMSGDLVTVDPSSPVSEAINLMQSEKVGAIAVVEEHSTELVGIISYVDILRAAADLLRSA